MDLIDFDDPVIEEAWCAERRDQVVAYLRAEGVHHGRVGEWPAWHVAPHLSIWAIESRTVPDSVGWWVVCGDGPTDYISAGRLNHPREAMRAIAARWLEVSAHMRRGEPHPTVTIGSPATWPELGPLLEVRAVLLRRFADDDGVWQAPE
jgi:hypothetical protein